MKLNGIFGTGSGKVGASVWAVSSGVQIVRPYQPNVSNPNTDAQVAQRAKLKLMSQIAAVLAPAIAFKKEGLVSARNKFVSANFHLAQFEQNKAGVLLAELDLTGGRQLLGQVSATSTPGEKVDVSIPGGVPSNVSAVVYVEAGYVDGDAISLVDVKLVTAGGANRTFPAEMKPSPESVVVYAYGIVDGDGKASAMYDNYVVTNPDSYAELGAIQNVISSSSVFTETTSTSLTA